MHSQVLVTLVNGQEFDIDPQGASSFTHEQARRWLDDEFMRLECEPLRASGKVLLADKVLVVTRDAGANALSDAVWAQKFAAAVVAALSKPIVRIDTSNMTVSY